MHDTQGDIAELQKLIDILTVAKTVLEGTYEAKVQQIEVSQEAMDEKQTELDTEKENHQADVVILTSALMDANVTVPQTNLVASQNQIDAMKQA